MVGVANNIMPAAWHTPISAQPPLYGVLISPKRYTFELLQQENCFTANFLEHKQTAIVAKTGSTSGKEIDKLKKFNIKFTPAEKVNGPILQDSYAAYECEKYAVEEYGDHFLFIGKIVLIHYKEEIMTSDGVVNEKKVSAMLYFGKDRYITTDPHSLSIFKRE